MRIFTRQELKDWLDNKDTDAIFGEDEPLLLVRADTLLFPQYDVHSTLQQFMDSPQVVKWLGDRAFRELQKDYNGVPEVRDHWRMLVELSTRDKERATQQ